MALQWREINIWPEREIVTFYAPCNKLVVCRYRLVLNAFLLQFLHKGTALISPEL